MESVIEKNQSGNASLDAPAKENGAMHKDVQRWIPSRWHCPNCGSLVVGFLDASGQRAKAQCSVCGACMIRIIKSDRHDVLNVFAPAGQRSGKSR